MVNLNFRNRFNRNGSSAGAPTGAASVGAATSASVSNVLTQDQQAVQDQIDQLFATHATLTRVQWDRMKQTEQWYLDLDPAQQDFADRKAKTRLAINELVEQTIQARQRANAQQIRNIQQENQDREDLARRLREETEKYQDAIEAKIAEAQDHLDNRRYKEAINVAKEGKDLLTGKK